ncbi:MAG: hypothetical protein ACE5EM_07715 [Sphingomonadales bacterium]
MATLDEIEDQEKIWRIEPGLGPSEQYYRMLYASPQFLNWLERQLKNEPKDRHRNISPYEQVNQLFYEFVCGSQMVYDENMKKLKPLGSNVWEMKTTDVRIFGYFYRTAKFIAVCGEMKKRLRRSRAYDPFKAEVGNFMNHVDLNPPKAMREDNLNALL